MSGRGRTHAAGLLLVAVFCLRGAAADAHMAATAIEEWGPFLPESVTCLRLMSRAVHTCFGTALAAEAACRDAQVRGAGCDTEQVENEVEAAALAARIAVTEACTEGQLTEIGYFGFADANGDLLNACVTQARATVSAAYAPAGSGMSSPAALACMTASSDYAAKVVRLTLEQQAPVFERMTVRLFDGPAKTEMVRQMRLALSATRQLWVAGLLERCPDFAAIYGRTPESFLRTLTQRTDCVLSKTYVNSAVSCSLQVCGNAVPEGTEKCDDGNTIDNDACHNDCTR